MSKDTRKIWARAMIIPKEETGADKSGCWLFGETLEELVSGFEENIFRWKVVRMGVGEKEAMSASGGVRTSKRLAN